MSENEEIAKAVQSVARFGEKSLETCEKAGSFFAKVFQEPIAEVSGIITDRLRFVRWRRLFQMTDDVSRLLESRGVHDPRAVPPKLALPIFEEGSLEEDETLQNLWTNLLTNAMDPNFSGELRYGFIDIIKNITGIEAIILNKAYERVKEINLNRDLSLLSNYRISKREILEMVDIDEKSYQVCIYNLMRVHCIGPPFVQSSILHGTKRLADYIGTDSIVLTPLGLIFIEACTGDG